MVATVTAMAAVSANPEKVRLTSATAATSSTG
jgi:hypothetical protein